MVDSTSFSDLLLAIVAARRDSIDIKFRVRVEFELMGELTTITKKYTKSGVADPLPEEQVLRAP